MHTLAGVGVANRAGMNSIKLTAFAALLLSSAACHRDKPADGPAETAGKKIDNAAEVTKEKAKDAKDETKEAAKDAKEATEESAKDTKNNFKKK